MEDVLKRIEEFADKAHGQQMRKYTPERYIVHPVRVMQLLQEYTNDITILATALLHDVLEDTPISAEEIDNFLKTILNKNEAERIVLMTKELTDEFIKEKYPQWNRRKRKEKEVQRLAVVSADAQTIKYADIIDNCIEIVKYDYGFAPKFLSECRTMLSEMKKGNEELYKRAIKTIDEARDVLKIKK